MSEKRIDEQDIEVLSFEDGMSAEKAKDAKKTTKRLLKNINYFYFSIDKFSAYSFSTYGYGKSY